MPDTDTKATALYRLYDSDETLLYVGIAVNPEVRLRVHSREKTWWPQVASRSIEWFPTRPSAEAAEVSAIAAERPRHNVSHSTTRSRGDAKAEYCSPFNKPRQIRIATQAWRDFGRATKAAGTSRAKVIVQFIAWYVRKPGAKLPLRPATSAWQQGKEQGS